MRVGDVHRRTVDVMDIQPSRAQDRDISSDSRDSCWGAAVVLYRDYISMVVSWMVQVVAVGSGQSVHHRGSGRMAVRDPGPFGGGGWGGWDHSCNWGGLTFSFASTLSAGWATAAWYLHTRAQIDDDSRSRYDYSVRLSTELAAYRCYLSPCKRRSSSRSLCPEWQIDSWPKT